ncbi:MAG: glycosyltransferase [Saprospiraceae bacterium]|nr:glycosyltransferase [Nitrospira sp.]
MPKPLVSFIVPVLNGEKYIGRCLGSIQRQNFTAGEYEIIVLDNGSADRTLAIIQRLGVACEVLRNLNVSALRNYGVLKSKGRYLAFVDSDVELLPEWITNGLAAFQERGVVGVGCFPVVPPNSTWVQKAWDLHQRKHQSEASMWPISWLPSMNLIVKRDDFIAIKGFNEKLETAEDVDLCYRLGERGVIICNSAMKAIHWGEAPDLRTFWRKEVWRGLGNIQGIFSHGLRWEEVPSIGYPIYILLFALAFFLGSLVDFLNQQIFMSPLALILLAIPPFLLALHTTFVAKAPLFLPHLFLIYLVYGFARAYALVKSLSHGGIFLRVTAHSD